MNKTTISPFVAIFASLLFSCSSDSSGNSPVTPTTPQGTLSSSSISVDKMSSVQQGTVSSSSIVISQGESSSSAVPQGEALALWSPAFGATVQTGGYWFAYDDQEDDGLSTWRCGELPGAKGDPVDECLKDTGIEIMFNVDPKVANGIYDDFGFAGLGFNLMDVVEGEKQAYGDLANFKGIRLHYSSSHKMFMQVVYDEEVLEFDVHRVLLSAGENQEVYLEWSDFRQANWGVSGNLLENLDQVKEMKFQAHSENFKGEASFAVHQLTLE